MNNIYLIAEKITKGKNISTYKMFLVLSVVTWLIGMSVITVPFFITGKISWQIMTIIIGYPTTFCGLFGGTIYLYHKDWNFTWILHKYPSDFTPLKYNANVKRM